MLFGTFIHILTSLIRDFCTSDRNFASTFFQIPPHDGHPWSWLVVGHCDYNPHNRLSLSRYMPCPAYQKKKPRWKTWFLFWYNQFLLFLSFKINFSTSLNIFFDFLADCFSAIFCLQTGISFGETFS